MGRKPLSHEERRHRETRITNLRDQGFSNAEIANQTGLSLAIVTKTVSRLITNKTIQPLRRVKNRGVSIWHNLADQRVQTIIEMVKSKATLQEIGDTISYSRERVRQIVKIIKQKHGEQIFVPDQPTWTIREAANKLGVSIYVIRHLCRTGEITTSQRSGRSQSKYFIKQSDIQTLHTHQSIIRQKKCEICSKVFTDNSRGKHRLTCSDACRKKRARQRRATNAKRNPTLRSLEGWHKNLWTLLQAYIAPEPSRDRWITLSEAANYTGLSTMQLWWLGHRKVVTTQPHPTKTWGNKPVTTYAASEMTLVKMAKKEYDSQNSEQD